MGTITIHFVGLFLFTGTDAEKRVAVIDADRDDVDHGGKRLPKHEAYFTATGVRDAGDWPADGTHYELKKTVQFDAPGVLHAPPDRWALPRIAVGCPDLDKRGAIPDSFFLAPSAGQTHAIIVLRAGELCAWRFKPSLLGMRGAVNTQLTIASDSFAITRDDGKRIEFEAADNPTIVFWNTEPVATPDERDWFWYYHATGQTCAPAPSETGVVAACTPPPGLNPLSLGCSNSNYP